MMQVQANYETVPGLLSREQAAKALGICGRNVDYLRERGQLPFIRIGRRILYAPTDLEQFIEARRVTG
jgi:excisionase family DNA binding protein